MIFLLCLLSYNLVCSTVDEIASQLSTVKTSMALQPPNQEEFYPNPDECKFILKKIKF